MYTISELPRGTNELTSGLIGEPCKLHEKRIAALEGGWHLMLTVFNNNLNAN